MQLAKHSTASREVTLLFFQTVLGVKGPLSPAYPFQSVLGPFQHPYSGLSLFKQPCSSSEGSRQGAVGEEGEGWGLHSSPIRHSVYMFCKL